MSREFAIIELDRPPQRGTTVLQQLAADTRKRRSLLRTERLSRREEQKLIASKRYVAHAPKMPVELIKPASSSKRGPDEAWGLSAVGAATSEFSGAGVTVAILDTGIDLDHDAFRSVKHRIVVEDFAGAGPGDPIGHGTHCAGTLFGQDVQGVRIGVAPGVARALVGRVFDAGGNADSLSLFRAMTWAITSEANVLSMSLGFDFAGVVETLIAQGLPTKLAAARALNDFLANMRVFDTLVTLGREMIPIFGGTVVVAAAGNTSTPSYRVPLLSPASADGVISVGAVRRSADGYRVASFSNTGVSVAAPGVDILSASPQRKMGDPKLAKMSGTSMAAPHVAGIAALWFEALKIRNENAISTLVHSHLQTHTFQGFASGTTRGDRGAGIVRAP